MVDCKKDDKILAEELCSLKDYVAKLENKLKGLTERPATDVRSREFPRIPLDARISFIGEFDIVEALGVNLSAGGICIEMKDDMYYEMKFENEGSEIFRRARLVWSRRLEKGGCRLGLEFVEDIPQPEF
jgi:hypothetical protein